MTEAEWLTCANARTMLTFLREKPGERKLRLFACACCRLRWPGDEDGCLERAVSAVESYLDGRGTWADVEAAYEEAHLRLMVTGRALDEAGWGTDRAAFRAAQDRRRVADAAHWIACGAYNHAVHFVVRFAQQGATKKQRAGFAELVREVFGNPFRAVRVDPAWLSWNGGLVRRLAQSIYDERRFGELGVLADALEEAGCGAGDLLAHCRSPGPHVLGCWAVDALLQKG
jgi:hypothetical protein